MCRITMFLALVLTFASTLSFADETISLRAGMDFTICEKSTGCKADFTNWPSNINIHLVSESPSIQRGAYTFTDVLYGYVFQGVLMVSKYSYPNKSPYYMIGVTALSYKESDKSSAQQTYVGSLIVDDLMMLNNVSFNSPGVEVDSMTSVHPGIHIGPTRPEPENAPLQGF